MNYNYLYSRKAKKHQRRINSVVRKFNKEIENDPWFNGRYFIRQVSRTFYEYDDHSGYIMYVLLRVYDKKNKIYDEIYGSVNNLCGFNAYKIWDFVNKFICEGVYVYEINNNIKIDKYGKIDIDYTKISSDEIIRESKSLYPWISFCHYE